MKNSKLKIGLLIICLCLAFYFEVGAAETVVGGAASPTPATTPTPAVQKPTAATTGSDNRMTTDISSPSFRLVICDGPDLNGVTGRSNPPNYIPCNFRGIMLQVNHLLTIAIIASILVAIGGFSYAGFLLMTGVPGKMEHGRKIFSNVAIGFIIILSAWFIVYQIVIWLTDNARLTVLLGTP